MIRKLFKGIKYYLLILLLAVASPISLVYAKETKTLTKSYEATAGVGIGDILVYDSQGELSDVNSTKNGITLFNGTVDNKYGLHLKGTPLGPGPVNFKGTVDDGGSFDVSYDITIDVAKAKKTVSQIYNATVGTSIGDILVYDSEGPLYPAVNITKSGLTLYSGAVNGVYGLRLKGTPDQGGSILFSGSTEDNETYQISFNVSVNVSKNGKSVTKTYDATVGKKFKSTLVYEAADTLAKVSTTKDGLTLKSDTVNGKHGLYLSGTPTKSGTTKFTSSVDEGGTIEVSYDITVNIAAKDDSKKADEQEDDDDEIVAEDEEEDEEKEKSSKKDTDKKEEEAAPVTTTGQEDDGQNMGLLIGIGVGVLLVIVALIIIIAKKKGKKSTEPVEEVMPIAPAQPSENDLSEPPVAEPAKPAEPADSEDAPSPTDGMFETDPDATDPILNPPAEPTPPGETVNHD